MKRPVYAPLCVRRTFEDVMRNTIFDPHAQQALRPNSWDGVDALPVASALLRTDVSIEMFDRPPLQPLL